MSKLFPKTNKKHFEIQIRFFRENNNFFEHNFHTIVMNICFSIEFYLLYTIFLTFSIKGVFYNQNNLNYNVLEKIFNHGQIFILKNLITL